VSTCPVCGERERTPLLEFNSLALLGTTRESELARYDYVLCSGCGLVYAARRPEGEQFRQLLRSFDENLGRPKPPPRAEIPAVAEERQALLAQFREGPVPASPEEGTAMLWGDRKSAEPHFEFLSRSLDLSRARVLEVRSKSGWILDALRRRFGAEPMAMPAFDAHLHVSEDLFGIPAAGVLDFERLEIPVAGEFDLILARHMFTHALDPAAMLGTLRANLRPGGHAYLFVENDDARLHKRGKNLIGEMKCFHFQNFDGPTISRCLRYAGFEPLAVHHPTAKSSLAVLARASAEVAPEPIGEKELRKRLDRYERWRDLSLLSLPREMRSAFGRQARSAGRRALRRGDATRRLWRVAPRRPLSLYNAAGYAELNRRYAAESAGAK
jgi:SAM-dependent methyltransferase